MLPYPMSLFTQDIYWGPLGYEYSSVDSGDGLTLNGSARSLGKIFYQLGNMASQANSPLPRTGGLE